MCHFWFEAEIYEHGSLRDPHLSELIYILLGSHNTYQREIVLGRSEKFLCLWNKSCKLLLAFSSPNRRRR